MAIVKLLGILFLKEDSDYNHKHVFTSWNKAYYPIKCHGNYIEVEKL